MFIIYLTDGGFNVVNDYLINDERNKSIKHTHTGRCSISLVPRGFLDRGNNFPDRNICLTG